MWFPLFWFLGLILMDCVSCFSFVSLTIPLYAPSSSWHSPLLYFPPSCCPIANKIACSTGGGGPFLLSDMIEGGITGKPCVLPVPPEWKHQFNQFWGNRYPVQNRYSEDFSWLLLTNVYREHTFFLSLVTQPYFRSLCRRVKTSNWSYQTAPKQGAGIAEIV